jgi:hypothetical protein
MSEIFSDIKESTKNFIDDRLKNPYITAVIAVWVFTNRVLVYGVFNFADDKTIEEKLIWISHQLNSFERFGFKGLWVGILWALIWGIFSMLLFNLLTGAGKASYKWINRASIWMLQKVEPAKWISLKQFNDVYQENEDLSKTNESLKTDISKFKDQIIELTKDNNLKNNSIIDLNDVISKLRSINDFDGTSSQDIIKSSVIDNEIESNSERVNTNIRIGKILSTMVEQFQLENIGQAKVIYYTFIENNENKILKSVLKRKTNIDMKFLNNYVTELEDYVHEETEFGKTYIIGKEEKSEEVNKLINLVELELNPDKNDFGLINKSEFEDDYKNMKSSDVFLSFITYILCLEESEKTKIGEEFLIDLIKSNNQRGISEYKVRDELNKMEIFNYISKYDLYNLNEKGKFFVKLFVDDYETDPDFHGKYLTNSEINITLLKRLIGIE